MQSGEKINECALVKVTKENGVFNIKFDDIIDGFVAGAKKALAPAVVIILVYTCLVITTYHPFQLTIYKAILGLSDGFNVATTALIAILSSLFNADPS